MTRERKLQAAIKLYDELENRLEPLSQRICNEYVSAASVIESSFLVTLSEDFLQLESEIGRETFEYLCNKIIEGDVEEVVKNLLWRYVESIDLTAYVKKHICSSVKDFCLDERLKDLSEAN